MNMTINDAVQKLQKEARFNDFPTFMGEVRSMTGSRLTSSRLETEIENSFWRNQETIRSIINPEEIIYRSRLARNAKAVIKLTDDELKQKRLYIGHRLLPFINPMLINSSELHFEDGQGNLLPKGIAALESQAAMQYILFLDLYVFQLDQDDNSLKLQYLDISTQPVEKYLEVTVLDYQSKKMRIEFISDSAFMKRHFINASKDKKLWRGIEEIVNSNVELISIDHTLMDVYHHFAIDLLSDPGSPFAQIYNQQKEIRVHVGQESTCFISSKKQELMLAQSTENLEYGKAKDLEGILREMGISFSSDFLLITMISDLITENEIDDDYILDDLLEIDLRLVNQRQRENLDKAYNRLRQKALKDFPKFDKSQVSLKFLNKLIDIEEELIYLVRDFDIEEDMDYKRKMELLMPAFEIDRVVSFLIEHYARNKTATASELRELNKIADIASATFESLREILDNV